MYYSNIVGLQVAEQQQVPKGIWTQAFACGEKINLAARHSLRSPEGLYD